MNIILLIIIFLFSMVIHEVSHGQVAYMMGDPTAKNAGRLTLNPIKHLDPFGSILLPVILILSNVGFIFGWAKPVPINPFNLRDQKYGEAKVALAGPLANISIALIFGLALRFLPVLSSGMEIVFGYIVWINLLLAIFNLIPVPPLDGSHILFALLPRLNEVKIFLQRYGFFILIFIFLFLFQWIISLVDDCFSLIVGVPFF